MSSVPELTADQTHQLLEKLNGVAKGLGIQQPELHATVALSMLQQVAQGVVRGVIESALVNAREEAEQQRTRAEAAENDLREAEKQVERLVEQLRELRDALGEEMEPTPAECPSTADMPKEGA